MRLARWLQYTSNDDEVAAAGINLGGRTNGLRLASSLTTLCFRVGWLRVARPERSEGRGNACRIDHALRLAQGMPHEIEAVTLGLYAFSGRLKVGLQADIGGRVWTAALAADLIATLQHGARSLKKISGSVKVISNLIHRASESCAASLVVASRDQLCTGSAPSRFEWFPVT